MLKLRREQPARRTADTSRTVKSGSAATRIRTALVIATVAATTNAAQALGADAKAPTLGNAFMAKVTRLCTRALDEKKAEPPFPFLSFNPTKPDVTKLQAIGRYEARGVEIFRSWYKQMLALGSPPTGRTQWRRLLAALHQHVLIIADQQTAASNRDGPRFTRDFYTGNSAQFEMTRAAHAAGVPICATAAGA